MNEQKEVIKPTTPISPTTSALNKANESEKRVCFNAI